MVEVQARVAIYSMVHFENLGSHGTKFRIYQFLLVFLESICGLGAATCYSCLLSCDAVHGTFVIVVVYVFHHYGIMFMSYSA